ncbi:MAG TPA: hypothetical protein ENF30_02885 [Candidatus Desulfofervidus auxilii]|uniref:Uncharacterized protein n=1 Tax=Desulfofervidus auxilii TaxID=1621989 RepID=A0A7V0IAM9_DESA2|nr:hypothetical protein [Candidatus Desulfofervidus auxilii]
MKRRIGLEIMSRMFLAHPLKSVQGFLKYQHYFSKKKRPKVVEKDILFSHPICIGAYCQKPHNCPAKRFTHRCLFAETLTLYSACECCEVKKMVNIAMMLYSPFYIMTTALNVFLDIFLSKNFSYYVVMICGYAKQLFLFPAFVFNMKGIFFTLGKGSCKGYKEFLLADEGYKIKQTFLCPLSRKKLDKLHTYLPNKKSHKFIFKKRIYYPS